MKGQESIRILFFIFFAMLMASWEVFAPRRKLLAPKLSRWLGNLGLLALDVVFVRLTFAVAPIEMAAMAAEKGWGLLNAYALDGWIAVALAVPALDLAVYLQHVMFHAIPLFWRFHKVHHADTDYDFTTGVRFHPGEILLSTLIKVGVVALLGPPVVAVLIFEVSLNAGAMFSHGNAHLPVAVDRYLRLITVTPDMHRVHHSVLGRELNSNFGFALPWWDRLFGTYREAPGAGHEGMVIGLAKYAGADAQPLSWLLALPFRGGDDRPVTPIGK